MTGRPDISEVLAVYQGSDGDATRRLYQQLEALGPIGHVAVNLFRACKSSERAKVYRGGGYRGMAYDRKQWAMDNLVNALGGMSLPDVRWGWGIDEALKARGDPHYHVLYVDLPTGQVSFHTGYRGLGRDYSAAWDGMSGQSPDRICRWIGRLFRSGAGGSATEAPASCHP